VSLLLMFPIMSHNVATGDRRDVFCYFYAVARLARVIAVDVPHHVTQRGNARQYILASDAERMVYLDLLRQAVQLHSLSVIGYCLMSNHVHLVVIPRKPEALALALKEAHGRYASYWNAAHRSSGHAWQGRFYSCPLDQPHLWEALRYTELNPVRAKMVSEPEAWPWSSAAPHCGRARPDICLDMETWRRSWSASDWRTFLSAPEAESEIAALRKCTHTGRPLGTPEFVKTLEQDLKRKLVPRKGGRPPKSVDNQRQSSFPFEEDVCE
jgi:putative transposase